MKTTMVRVMKTEKPKNRLIKPTQTIWDADRIERASRWWNDSPIGNGHFNKSLYEQIVRIKMMP